MSQKNPPKKSQFYASYLINEEEKGPGNGDFGWVYVSDMQGICVGFIHQLYPDCALLRDEQAFKADMFLEAMSLAYGYTPAVNESSMQIPFDVAAIVCEIARLLWLQVALNNGTSEKESRELFSTFQGYDRDGEGLRSQKFFECLRQIGINVVGDEQ